MVDILNPLCASTYRSWPVILFITWSFTRLVLSVTLLPLALRLTWHSLPDSGINKNCSSSIVMHLYVLVCQDVLCSSRFEYRTQRWEPREINHRASTSVIGLLGFGRADCGRFEPILALSTSICRYSQKNIQLIAGSFKTDGTFSSMEDYHNKII